MVSNGGIFILNMSFIAWHFLLVLHFLSIQCRKCCCFSDTSEIISVYVRQRPPSVHRPEAPREKHTGKQTDSTVGLTAEEVRLCSVLYVVMMLLIVIGCSDDVFCVDRWKFWGGFRRNTSAGVDLFVSSQPQTPGSCTGERAMIS